MLVCFSVFTNGQGNVLDSVSEKNENNIEFAQAKLLGNHPLGIYLMRLESAFKLKPVSEKQFTIQWSSANVWQPLVTAFKPVLESDRVLLNSIPWHEREFVFDYRSIATEKISLQADAVIKGFHVGIEVPIDQHQQLKFELRSYLFTKGKIPLSTLSSDSFIEFFHSHIAGGEDPFARRYYGLDKSKVSYFDEKGNSIEKNENDFVIAGLELHYTYFFRPELFKWQELYLNLGAHLGINTNRYNPSSDIGFSAEAIKQFKLKNNKKIQIAGGTNLTSPHFVKWGERVNINNTKFNFAFDSRVSYQGTLKNEKFWTFALNYHHQSPYQNPNDLNGIVLSGERTSTHWHYALSQLYEPLSVWSFIFQLTFTNYSVSVYVSEDLKVNNAPDIQTGIQLSFLCF
ncbi:MAG TPA: hypothetical protein DCG69_04965 [Bacteroidales bacterium]|nr:hypothetical protein [Bacteroidales bacterium]